ncbi:MAG: hypothetical protein WCV81_01075 [Microgenomates group bacterium]
MKEKGEQMFWAHTLGLIVLLPSESTKAISSAILKNNSLPEEECQRLKILVDDPHMKKRFPTPNSGRQYMYSVDLNWRQYLYAEAQKMTSHIVDEAKRLDLNNFAVLLFGSVAKGLTRDKYHDDPSNVDLTVIGDFTENTRNELFDYIRPYRAQGGERIHNNIGVHIQNLEKLTRNNYNEALTYIGSLARPLHDPSGIWQKIEHDAIEYSRQKFLQTAARRACSAIRRHQHLSATPSL